MSTVDDEGREIAQEAVLGAGIQMTATGLGMFFPEPYGTVVSLGTAAVLQFATARRRRNADVFATALVESTGMTPDQVAMWAGDKEGRSYLLTSAFDAALAARAEQKVRALARLVAEGVRDDKRIDYAAVVVDALKQLEAPHIQVLHAMVHDADRRPPSRSGEPVGAGAWMTSQLKAHLPHLAPAIVPICSALASTGMATSSGLWGEDNDAPWTIMEFGVDCLDYLEAATK